MHKKKIIVYSSLILIMIFGAILRLYQIIKFKGLLQFDVFDWASISSNILSNDAISLSKYLWSFPLLNSLISVISGIDLSLVYLLFGLLIILVNTLIIFILVRSITHSDALSLFVSFIYLLIPQIVSRSINYLPETVTYLIGPIILWTLVGLIKYRDLRYIILLIIFNLFYIKLHQGRAIFIFISFIGLLIYIILNKKFLLEIIKKNKQYKIYIIVFFILFISVLIFMSRGILESSIKLINQSKGDSLIKSIPESIQNIIINLTPVIITLFVISIIFIFKEIKNISIKILSLIILLTGIIFFSFLYIVPKITPFVLVPWRFYSWTILYFIILIPFAILWMKKSFSRKFFIVIFCLIIIFFMINMIRSDLIYDDMISADFKTLDSIKNISNLIPEGSIVITTATNFFQTRFILGYKINIINDRPCDVFLSNLTIKIKSINETLVTNNYTDHNKNETFILISKFQLLQKPTKLSWWNMHSCNKMDINSFKIKGISQIYEDDNILLFKLDK